MKRKEKLSVQLAMKGLKKALTLRKKTDFTRTVKYTRTKQTKYV